MQLLKSLHQTFLPPLRRTMLAIIKPGSLTILAGMFAVSFQVNVFAEQHIHSLTAVERQQNQTEIQNVYIKKNPRQSNEKIVFQKITQNIYIAKNLGAISGLVIGDDGLLLIDTKEVSEAVSEKLMDAVRKISDKPIKYVINTHSHFDHAGGNAYFSRLGATIIAQENFRYTPVAHHLRFDKKFSLTMGSEEILAYHTPSHTLDSTIIYLPNSNVLFMGDNFSSSWLLYEGAKGGDEYKKTIDLALSLADDKTIVVPGHGELSQRSALIRNNNAKNEFRQRLGQLYAKGQTIKQMSEDEKTQTILTDYERIYNDGSPVHLRDIQDVLDANFVKPFSLSPSLFSDYVGQYKTGNGKITEIVQVDGKLLAREEGSFIAELKQITKTRFDLVAFPYTQNEQIEFTQNKSGQTDKMSLDIPNRFQMNYWLKDGERTKVKMH